MKNLTFILLCCAVSFAQAQTETSVDRKGFYFGSSLGAARSFQNFSGKKQSNTDFAFDAKAGYMLSPNFAILLTTNVSAYDYNGTGRPRKRDFGVLAPSVQYWLNDKLSLSGGIGLGVDAPVFYDIKPGYEGESKYFPGLGVVTALQYELWQKNNFAVDVKTKVTYRNVNITEGNTRGISTAILLGFNYY